jgi:ElaB/YqjD/DUF883 family membrane-anchored ribosome-binding protein
MNASAMKDLRATLSELELAMAKAEAVLANASAEPNSALDALRARTDAVRDWLRDFYSGARTRVVTTVRTADDAVRDHPYQSIAVALGVGLAIGLLLQPHNHHPHE